MSFTFRTFEFSQGLFGVACQVLPYFIELGGQSWFNGNYVTTEPSTNVQYKHMGYDLTWNILLAICQLFYLMSWYQGIKVEGLLMNQYLHLFAYVVQLVGYVLYLTIPVATMHWTLLLVINSIWGTFFLIYLMMVLVYGCGGLDRFEASGEYKVGAQEFWSEETKCKVLVYYPIDESEYIDKIRHRPFRYWRFESTDNFVESL